jgi:hypothetical protein
MRFADLLLVLRGSSSGEQIIKAAAATSGAITLPAGTTDFSATGGASQVVQQPTAGGAFTVAQLTAADIGGGVAPLNSPAFTGNPTAPTPTAGDNDTSIATTAFVATSYAPLLSPSLTGTPTAPTAAAATNTTQLATTAFVQALPAAGITALPVTVAQGGTGATAAATALGNLGGAPLASPTFTGTPAAPTAAAATNTTQLATTAYVKSQNYVTGNQTITLSGDITGSGATAITTILPNVNANVGTFQGIAVNAKGQVTAAVNQGYLTGNQTITLSGDVTGSGTTAIPVTLATVPVPKGGTGLTAGTSGGVPYYSSTTAMTSSALLAAGQVVAGGGAGAAPTTIANGQLPATATNDSAAAGKVGEFISSVIPSASAVTLTNNIIVNLTSLSLTAGDWSVDGNLVFQYTGTVTFSEGEVTTISVSMGDPDVNVSYAGFPHSANFIAFATGAARFSIASTTSIYLTCRGLFSTGAGHAYGVLRARRVR